MLKTYDFIDISNAMISITLGVSTTASPPIVIVILRHRRLRRADHAAPDKS
jgi:hypothetical protein